MRQRNLIRGDFFGMGYPIQVADFYFVNKKGDKKVAKDIFVVYDKDDKLTHYDRRLKDAYSKIFSKTTIQSNFEKKSLKLVKIDIKDKSYGVTNWE